MWRTTSKSHRRIACSIGTFSGPQRQQIAAMLAPRLSLRTDRRLPLEWTDVVAVPEDQTLRLTFRVSREQPGA